MINNEFRLIGVATSNLKLVQHKNVKTYSISVEVERPQKKDTYELTVYFYDFNRLVDFSFDFKGKTVVVGGYIAHFSQRITTLVGTNIIVINKDGVGLEEFNS